MDKILQHSGVESAKNKLDSLLSTLQPEIRTELSQVISDYIALNRIADLHLYSGNNQNEQTNVDAAAGDTVGAANEVTDAAVAVAAEPENLPKSKRRVGENDLLSRHEVKKLKGIAKLEGIINLYSNPPDDRSTLTNGARAFICQCDAVVTCFKNHFKENKLHTTFGKKVCKGGNDSCFE
ncbi:hypothetical protein HK100_001941 [Physocladia obscura]|uniref:Uncharacterized protein n=1 Tax=Physocladia obscura TaxID=109957 RepID=A0AAD5XAN8_9FUNG|nr:hypothetical protein HK100_001941 [Physocladia obscura]